MHDPINDTPLIRHYIAGGTESGGGIGRLVGYVLAAEETRFRHVVVDTRGPVWSPLRSPVHLARAMAVLGSDGVRGRRVLHHMHIAGRGSTLRKLILGNWARVLSEPYILHLHDYEYAADISTRSSSQFRAIQSLFQGAEHVIVLGQRDLRTVTQALGVPHARTLILRNCVPDPGARTRRLPGPVHILFLGRLGPRKGIPELLAALADPAIPSGSWRATLAGDGAVEQTRDEIARLGLAGQVRLTGWVNAEEAARLRSEADILVLPSHAEGFAMAVLEGLAQGIAVITTPVGAHGEVLVDAQNSLLVPPGNVRVLAQALARLISDSAFRDQLGDAGRRLFKREFGMQGYVRALEALQARHFSHGIPFASSV
ncbi:MAG: glycosyltransferase family 4 protein [Litorimonas sp.]